MVENVDMVLEKTVEIPTPRLRLRRFTPADASAVFEYASDAETVRYLIWEGVKTRDEAALCIENVYMRDNGYFAIALREGNRCVGCFDIRLDTENEKAGFGYVLRRDMWNQGYATEVLRAVVDFCFDVLELNRVAGDHFSENPASGRVMEKSGLRYEGLARAEMKVKGAFIDFAHYAILREDWARDRERE